MQLLYRPHYFILLILLSCTSIILGLYLGVAGELNIKEFFSQNETSKILVQLRLPRVLLGFIVGAGLAMSGVVLQTFFRNDLSSPYTLGISSFASLGAVIGIYLNLPELGIYFSSSLGALFAIFILLFFAKQRASLDTSSILLIGISLGLGASSLITLFQHLGGPDKLFQMTKWLEGGIEIISYQALIVPFITFLLISSIFFRYTKELNLIQVSFHYAKSKGVEIDKSIFKIILPSSIFIGVVTSLCGPIGFIGLIIPHIARVFTGANHTNLLFVSLNLGGSFLVLMDLVSRLIIAPAELPVGILCGIIGAPFFLLILFRKH